MTFSSPSLRLRLVLVGFLVGGALAPPASAQDPASRIEQNLDELDRLSDRIDAIRERRLASEGQVAQTFLHQSLLRWRDHHELIVETAELVETNGATTQARSRLAAAVFRELSAGEAAISEMADSASQLREKISDLPLAERFPTQVAVSEVQQTVRWVYTLLVDDYEVVETVDLDVPLDPAGLDSNLLFQAGVISADLEFSVERRRFLKRRLDRGVANEEFRLEVEMLDERIANHIDNLETAISLLERRGLDESDLERLLLTTTGEIGLGLLNPQVVRGLFVQWGTGISNWFSINGGTWALRLAIVLVILVITRIFAGLVRRVTARLLGLGRVNVSDLLQRLIVGGVSKLVWLVGLLVILSVLSVNLGPALAGLGIIGFVLGFALQDTLGNFAAGLMIMMYKPFDVGDLVTIGGVLGRVKEVSLVSTITTTLDNQLVVIPNGKVWGGVINNATAQGTRRVDLEFRISHDADVEKARRVIMEILTENELVLEDPAPVVEVHKFGDWSVDLTCRPWCATADLLKVRWSVTQAVKERLDAEGIGIAVPVSDVRLKGGEPPCGEAVPEA